MSEQSLVLVGDSAFAEVAYEYFTHQSDYKVKGFAVEKAHRERDTLMGLPVVDFEEMTDHFPPADHDVFVAVVYTQMNRLRTRLLTEAKERGYTPASFISPNAQIWPGVEIGEHCFIFENNVIQPFVSIGDNVVLWSGNHIGHHSVIERDCFISSHVVISGLCRIRAGGFLGVNAAVGNNVTIGKENWIGPGMVLTKDTKPGQLYGAPKAETPRLTTWRFFKVTPLPEEAD